MGVVAERVPLLSGGANASTGVVASSSGCEHVINSVDKEGGGVGVPNKPWTTAVFVLTFVVLAVTGIGTLTSRTSGTALGAGAPQRLVGVEQRAAVDDSGGKEVARAIPRLGAVDSKRVAAFLGQEPQELGNICESGIHEPAGYGHNERFTQTLVHLLPYADMTYIICTKACEMVIPEELKGKVLMVNGYEIDSCLNLNEQDHWIKASLSHGAAIAHAKANNFERAAVLEEDMTSAPNPYEWQTGDYQELNDFLEGPEKDNWNVIRLGYRPVQHEHGGSAKKKTCSPQCQCEAHGSTLCFMRTAGCELHSSDAYILRSTQFSWFLRTVAVGTIIDYGLLQATPGQLILTPQITYQTDFSDFNDETDVDTQLKAGAMFSAACFPKPMLVAA